jgi:hypothetical protein
MRAKQERDLGSRPHGFVPEFKKRADFVEYFARLSDSRHGGKMPPWRNTL